MMLSICIPTYNRAHYLQQCLESVLVSIKSFENSLEMVISDNASTDNTQKLMEVYSKQYSFIRYFRNEQNIGAEANFFLVTQRASGQYCLILGDDDQLSIDAIKIILNAIEEYKREQAIFILNYLIFDKTFSCVLNHSFHEIQKNCIYLDKNLVMSQFGPTLSFISSVVFPRDIIQTINLSYYNYFKEYGFSFLYMIYDYLSTYETAYYIHTPVVYQRAENSVVDIKKFFFVGMPKVFDTLIQYGYSNQAIQTAKEQVFEKYLKYHLLDMKLNSVEIDAELTNLTYDVIQSKKNRIIAFCLFLLPSDFFIQLRKFKKWCTQWYI